MNPTPVVVWCRIEDINNISRLRSPDTLLWFGVGLKI